MAAARRAKARPIKKQLDALSTQLNCEVVTNRNALSKIRLASEVCVCVFVIHKFHKLYTSFPLQGDPGPEGLRGLPGMVGPQVR